MAIQTTRAFSLKARSRARPYSRWIFHLNEISVAPLRHTVLALTVLIGLVGLAIDVGTWYWTNRALQNAATPQSLPPRFKRQPARIKPRRKLSTRQYGCSTG